MFKGLSIVVRIAAILLTSALSVPALAQDCQFRWDTAIGMPGVPSGYITSMVVFDDGAGPALYVGGDFSEIGGISANNIARFDGQSFFPLGEGVTATVSSYVNTMAVYDDGNGPALYVGGFFSMAGGASIGYSIAKWDGQQWSDVGGGLQGATPQAYDMVVFNDGDGDALYVGGSVRSPGAQYNDGLVKWDGQQWSGVGNGLGGSLPMVYALTVFEGPSANGRADGYLAVGGRFEISHELPIKHLALWDGQDWHALGAGIGGTAAAQVTDLAVYDDGAGPALCVAGYFSTAGGVPVLNAARWHGGNAWSPMGSNLYTLPIYFGLFDDGAGESLYVSGPLAVMKWEGDDWSAIGSGYSNGARTFAAFNDGAGEALYVGGAFTTIEGRPARRLAAWRCLNPLGDINGDGYVDVADLVELLATWGDCPPPPANCPADLDFDGTVGVLDLLLMLADWS